jgi:two-component system copper resistance phosphate regulon response regulator CusR
MVEECFRGLDAGADDYFAKPLLLQNLPSAFARYSGEGAALRARFSRFETLKSTASVTPCAAEATTVDFSPQEFALLEFLMRHEGRPVSRTAIVEQVWKLNFDTMTNVVNVYINYLRRKVDSGYDRAMIRTIRGVGYQIGGNGQHA